MNRTTTLLKFLGCLAVLMSLGEAKLKAQTPFDGPNYANHWIVPSQTYVRLGVKVGGLQRVAFTALQAVDFPTTNPQNFHLYHRGKEVTIISTNNEEVVFYGETNDGSSDALLYRPTSARMNPYSSFFSDEGAYFLTVNGTARTVMPLLNQTLSELAKESYHLRKDLVTYKTSFSQSITGYNPPVLNSFYENGESWTSPSVSNSGPTSSRDYNFVLKNRVINSVLPKLKLLVHGRNNYNQNIVVSLGHSGAPMRSAETLTFTGLTGYESNITLQESDLNTDGSGVLNLVSTIYDALAERTGRYSVAYYSFTYPSQFTMEGQDSVYFNLPVATTSGWTKVEIAGAAEDKRVFDITDVENIKEIVTNWNNGTSNLEVMVQRVSGQSSRLYITDKIQNVTKVSKAPMTSILPSNYNYLIITNTDLETASKKYRDYRATPEGGNFKPLVMDIKDLYNQFNYGEPSPVAIKRYVDFMISDGDLNKYLLLIGRSISLEQLLVKELPGQVPTVGYPGSDVLLVTGLAGGHEDVPTIPVGRISANNSDQVDNYLAKVRSYEGADSEGATWRKEITQMYGGKTVSEANQFIGILNSLQTDITSTPFSGTATLVTQPAPPSGDIPQQSASIASLLNSGTGLLTYFGHGTYEKTYFDVGFVSNSTFGYSNVGKYPVMYFNGCGIGNMFSDQATLSTDWVVEKDKGAIAFITNSYFGYTTPSSKHLRAFSKKVYNNSDASRKRLGNILQDVAAEVVAGGALYEDLDRQNLHQFLLQGDPALRILIVNNALPVDLLEFKGKSAGQDVILNWTTTSERNNRHFDIQQSRDAKSFETIGRVEGKGTTGVKANYEWKQENVAAGIYYYRLRQVDNNGASTLSYIIPVRVGEDASISVGPSPTDGQLEIYGVKQAKYNARVFSIAGLEVYNSVVVEGKLDLHSLKPGVYIVKLSDDSGFTFVQKIVKN